MKDYPPTVRAGLHRDGLNDVELQLVTDWLAGELPSGLSAIVRDRLLSDAAFHEKALPLLKVWHQPDHVWRRARKRADADARRNARRRAQSWRDPRDVMPTVGRDWVMVLVNVLPILIIVIPVIILVLMATPKTQQWTPPKPNPAYETVSASEMEVGVPIVSGPGQTRALLFAGGSRIVLREHSTYTWTKAGIPGSGYLEARLDGEATFNLSKEIDILFLTTSTGKVKLLGPGNYAVRCEPGCAAMLVTVGMGYAGMRTDTSKSGFVIITGSRGRVPRGGQPEKVLNAVGWPVVEP
jgi:hypothetical protein